MINLISGTTSDITLVHGKCFILHMLHEAVLGAPRVTLKCM